MTHPTLTGAYLTAFLRSNVQPQKGDAILSPYLTIPVPLRPHSVHAKAVASIRIQHGEVRRGKNQGGSDGRGTFRHLGTPPAGRKGGGRRASGCGVGGRA
jgi:hypothetical protein